MCSLVLGNRVFIFGIGKERIVPINKVIIHFGECGVESLDEHEFTSQDKACF